MPLDQYIHHKNVTYISNIYQNEIWRELTQRDLITNIKLTQTMFIRLER